MANTKTMKQEEEKVQLTQGAYDDLLGELENRKEVLRKEIADEIASARELGDLSENHAYTVAMERKEMNENRINEIEDILTVAEIVHENKSDTTVGLGEKVEIQNLKTKKNRIVKLVGSESTQAANPIDGEISTSSPIGKAILGAKIGQKVKVELPSEDVEFLIVKFVK